MRPIIIISDIKAGISIHKNSFEDRIRQYGYYAFLTNQSWIVFTTDSVVSVRDSLLPFLAPNDKLFVAELSAPAAWTTTMDKAVSEWLISNLKQRF
jgi:hypothetical protein